MAGRMRPAAKVRAAAVLAASRAVDWARARCRGLFSGTPAGMPAPPSKPSKKAQPAQFIDSVDVKAAGAKMKLVQIADEMIALLAGDPNAEVHVSVEITADFPQGVEDGLKGAATENAGSLGLKFRIGSRSAVLKSRICQSRTYRVMDAYEAEQHATHPLPYPMRLRQRCDENRRTRL